MIILPGTKNTMEDLLWLRQCGLEAAILRFAAQGKPVWGICGGYQMLGQELADPHGVEHGGSMAGLGLLPTRTVFEEQKVRTQVEGHFRPVAGMMAGLSGVGFSGYEIHMGQTEAVAAGPAPLAAIETISGRAQAKEDGLCCGNVYGTYIHGIFDREEVSKAVVISLFQAKGLDYAQVQSVDIQAYKEQQYDLLAEGLRQNLDLEMVYRIVDQGI